jgi:transcriptional regulator with XRE-family HTH domain
MTQVELAQAAGISQGFLSQVEAGQRDVSTSTLVQLAHTLKTTAEYLLGLDKPHHQETGVRGTAAVATQSVRPKATAPKRQRSRIAASVG